MRALKAMNLYFGWQREICLILSQKDTVHLPCRTFWPFSKGCFPHSWWHTEFGIRLLAFCKAFGVQSENTHSQSGCGYDQIRLYEL